MLHHDLPGILDDLVRGYDGDAWHGPPLRKVLEGVTAEVADSRPIAGAHSIAEIVAHLAAWEGVAADRIIGCRPIESPPGGNFPAPGDGLDTWFGTLSELDRQYARLVQVASGLDDGQLGEIVAGKDYDVAHMLRGV